MTRPAAFFLTPETPALNAGGGPARSASLLAYLQRGYDVETASFTLPSHSKSALARLWRNSVRWIRGRPPLLDRYSDFENQLHLRRSYSVAVIEHFWCAPYAATLRPHAQRLVLDLHNVESVLARAAARGLAGFPFRRFARAYERLEKKWLPDFDAVLVASEEDRRRVDHPNVIVYPNALPESLLSEGQPLGASQRPCIVFSGNLEYHPNVEAARWFHARVWPRVREAAPEIEWRLVGRNPHAIERIVRGDPRICILGPVADAVAELAAAQVCIVPLLSGSGTRFKILEAWAAGRAVVSTTLGAEGLRAQAGQHLLLADDPQGFADAILRLLREPDLRSALGENGRALCRERYTWAAAWRALEIAGL